MWCDCWDACNLHPQGMWRDRHPPRLSIVASFQHFSGGSGIRDVRLGTDNLARSRVDLDWPRRFIIHPPILPRPSFFSFFPTDLWTFLVNDLSTFITLISTYLNKITRENYAFMIDLEVSGLFGCGFKQQWLHFKQQYTYFFIFFHPYIFQKTPNYNFLTILPNIPNFKNIISNLEICSIKDDELIIANSLSSYDE